MTQQIDPLDLVLLIEEASEVIQAATKCLRFGPENSWPGYQEGRTKWEVLITELGDMKAIIDRLGIQSADYFDARVRKHDKLKQVWGPEVRGRGML